MRIERLTASADLIGRRVRVAWTFTPEPGETLADVPRVTVRRKERDFAFPPPAVPDPYVVYDSAAFPPAPVPGSLVVGDLADRDTTDGALLVREQTVTVAEVVPGSPAQRREVLRRMTRTAFTADRTAVWQEVELLDVGGRAAMLSPGITYYYELSTPALPPVADPAPRRVTVTPGEAHGLNRTLYQLIPEIHRRHDTIVRPRDAGTDLLPEASASGGQLRRLVDVFGMSLDAIRSSAEGLWGLHDPATVDPKFLPPLAQWIGWDLTTASELPRQRNEIRDAPRLYESVGSLPGLRTLVDHYTGWSTRVVEFVEHLARTNAVAQRNIFALVDRGGEWSGTDDAAPPLGFASPADAATGGGGVAAELTGDAVEPFALREGMTLTIAVDGAVPAAVTFGARDFADIAAATAAEVARVVDSRMGELDAQALAGAVWLRSHRVDDGSAIEVAPTGASLVSLDGAPNGRLTAFVDKAGRLWVASATTVGPGAGSDSRLQVKACLRGAWRDAQPVEPRPLAAQADPAGCAMADGRLWLAWVERPGTTGSELRFRLGVPQPFEPARLLGEQREPFALRDGARMVLTGYGSTETFVVHAANYASVGAATAAEVAVAINGQLLGVAAATAANGALTLRTIASGPGTSLRIDLAGSTAARALGLGDRARLGRGSWDSRVDWTASMPVAPLGAGRHADCAAAVDHQGSVRLFWSTHRDNRWRIARIRWDDRVLAATGSGVGVRAPDGTLTAVTTSDGLPSDDVRGVATDADGSSWYATAAGGALRRTDGTFAALSNATTAGGLADDDVRAVAVAPNGDVWFAHAQGASARDAAGVWRTVTKGDGLASDDCRHVTVSADGTVWFATAAGLTALTADGEWRTWTTADGLPDADVRHSAVAVDGSLWAATAAGLAVVAPDGTARAVGLAGLGASPKADDVRAVALAPSPSSVVWAATAAGLVELVNLRLATSHGTVDGLPSDDCRAVLVAPDGAVWAGTPAGAARRPPDAVGGFRAVTTADGLPGDDVRALHGPWSAPLEFPVAGGGDRDPCVLVDATRIWLAWSQQRAGGDPTDTWLLRARRFEGAVPSWGPVLALTSLPPGARATDRDPCLVRATPDGARLYFRTDRGGGEGIWRADVDGAGKASAPAAVSTGPPADSHPAAVTLPDRSDWLLLRSDRSVSIGRLGGGLPDAGGAGMPSRRAADEASLRRFAGSLTVALDDGDRNRSRRQFGDLLSYTPQKPRGFDDPPLLPDEVYTRGTVGLYVEHGPAGRVLTRADSDRLRQLLERFLPANLRAVVVLRPSALLVEHVFAAGHEPSDAYLDSYPFSEKLGDPTDETSAGLPDWLFFLATDSASVTADPSDLETLRRKTWRPPPQ